METEVGELDAFLDQGVKAACSGTKRVGVVFSGGIDSVLAAKKAEEFCDAACYTVGFPDSADFRFARIAADELGLELNEVKLDSEALEEALTSVLKLVGEPNPLAVGVGVPMYLSSKAASEDGLSIMLCGQGADELFGGYWRYVDAYVKRGPQAVLDWMSRDVDSADIDNLNRDRLVTSANGVELRFPYLLPELRDYALDLPLEWRVREVDSGLSGYECVDEFSGRVFVRKYVLREVAAKNGLPKEIINRPKKAAQYGSLVHKNMDRLARKKGYKKKARDLGEKSHLKLYLRHLLHS
ncbi:MAG: hypothetical protein GF334_02025 [Candidatus Altiarchaeales archaeon]|nr:hypothetical protein [Candidatus Altiarchaeales archaeon]